jgi:integrase/recombinase XerD
MNVAPNATPAWLLASPRRRAPYLYSETEISRILAAARQLGPRHSLRPHTLTTLLGLLASTGLRVSEALNLSVSDIRLSAKPAHLVIRETKFGKSRLVPLHPSAVEPLCEYAYLRKRLGYAALSEAFFVSEQGAALSYSSLEQTFQRLLALLGIQAQDGKRRPTLHAFRHSFAVARLCAWQAAGVDVRVMLPHLSVYLGHVSPSESYWYLSATPELLVTASRVFAAFVAPGGEEWQCQP